MIAYVLPGVLARSQRPGYNGRLTVVGESVVSAWCEAAQEFEIRSILCLLADEHLNLYASLSQGGLLETYESRGFVVAHVPIIDHKQPPLDEAEKERVWEAFQSLPRPVLIHCSAGIDRTGAALEHIIARLEPES